MPTTPSKQHNPKVLDNTNFIKFSQKKTKKNKAKERKNERTRADQQGSKGQSKGGWKNRKEKTSQGQSRKRTEASTKATVRQLCNGKAKVKEATTNQAWDSRRTKGKPNMTREDMENPSWDGTCPDELWEVNIQGLLSLQCPNSKGDETAKKSKPVAEKVVFTSARSKGFGCENLSQGWIACSFRWEPSPRGNLGMKLQHHVCSPRPWAPNVQTLKENNNSRVFVATALFSKRLKRPLRMVKQVAGVVKGPGIRSAQWQPRSPWRQGQAATSICSASSQQKAHLSVTFRQSKH